MVSPDALPLPAVYARLGFEARGAICASLSAADIRAFAEQYAAFLTTSFGSKVTPAEVASQMFLCAVGWRGREVAQR